MIERRRKQGFWSSIPRRLISWSESFGLGVVFIATVVSVATEVWHMIVAREVVLGDLLLLFIFLEVISMVGIYYVSHRVPVRYPIYIAITALARYLILDAKSLDPWAMLAVGGTVLVLASSVLVIRYGQKKYPYNEDET
jgi:protein PsiE